LIVAVFAGIGFAALRVTHAATYAVAAESESGSLSGNAAAVSSSAASNGKAVLFGKQPSPQPPAGQKCTSPAWHTSDHQGMWSNGGYIVANDMWNEGAGLGSQTIYACSYHSWYVTSNQTDSQGAVKTYPNVHKDYHNWGNGHEPKISSFNAIKSSFAYQHPTSGAYDVAYDIWVNGVADSNSTEIMVWTDNHQPAYKSGNAGSMTLDGHHYHIITSDNNHYIAIIADSPVSSGTFDLLGIFHDLMGKGMLANDSTLGQVDFGIEFSSTGGQSARFACTNFSISDN
jgi:hypothetical protein